MAPLLSCRRPPHPRGLSLGTYSTCDGWGVGLDQDIWSVQLGSFNIMPLVDIKISREAYFRNRLVYDVVCLSTVTRATGGAQGGVDLFVLERPQGWSVELTHFHGSNVVSCEVVSGGKRTLLVGVYLPPLHTWSASPIWRSLWPVSGTNIP